MYNNFFIIILLFFFSSCSPNIKKQSDEKKTLVDIQVKDGLKNLTNKFLLSEVVKDIEIIPLETSEECLLNNIGNIAIGEKDIFIVMLKTLLRFDRNSGEFLNAVARFGEGPGDVNYCKGIGLDEPNGLVYTLTSPLGANEIKSFTYDGVWKNTMKAIKTGAWMEAGTFGGSDRLYSYFNGRHIFRRMLPIQDGSKNLWQVGIMDEKGMYLMKITDPACLEHQQSLNDHKLGTASVDVGIVKYSIFSASPIQNRYYNHINYLFDANDTIYRYSMKQELFKPRYILHCGERPDFASLHKMAKDNGYFRCIFVSDILETKEYLFLTAKQDVYSYLLRVNKEDGSVTSIRNGGEFKETPFMKVRYVDVETPKFINDLCGGLPFYPFDQNENSWIAKYEAADLLEQIDIDELKVTEVLMPEKKAQLIRILENLKEDDNPVIMIATLK